MVTDMDPDRRQDFEGMTADRRSQDFEGMKAGVPGKPSVTDPRDVIIPLAKRHLEVLPNPEDWSLIAAGAEHCSFMQLGGMRHVLIRGSTRTSGHTTEKASPAAKKQWGPVVLESKLPKAALTLEAELTTFTEWLWRYLDPIRHSYADEPYLTTEGRDYRLLTYSTEGRERLYHRVTWIYLLDVILPRGERLQYTEYRMLFYEAEIGKRGAALDVFPLGPKRIEVNLRCSDDALVGFQAELYQEIEGRFPVVQRTVPPWLEDKAGRQEGPEEADDEGIPDHVPKTERALLDWQKADRVMRELKDSVLRDFDEDHRESETPSDREYKDALQQEGLKRYCPKMRKRIRDAAKKGWIEKALNSLA